MHRFKLDNHHEHRQSLQQAQKAENLHLATLLDKCTQILREDRIWLRNQIKAGDEQVIEIFRMFGKPTQLQHLQIKLRKHIHGIKIKQKIDQLNKFKENLNFSLGVSEQEVTRKSSNQGAPVRQRPLRQNQSMVSKYQKMSSVETYKLKNKSDEHFHIQADAPNCNEREPRNLPPHPPRKQGSPCLKNFQQILSKHNYNQEVIEERDSENVTSARLRRHEGSFENHTAYIQEENQFPFRMETINYKQKQKEWEGRASSTMLPAQIKDRPTISSQQSLEGKSPCQEDEEQEEENSIFHKHFNEKESPNHNQGQLEFEQKPSFSFNGKSHFGRICTPKEVALAEDHEHSFASRSYFDKEITSPGEPALRESLPKEITTYYPIKQTTTYHPLKQATTYYPLREQELSSDSVSKLKSVQESTKFVNKLRNSVQVAKVKEDSKTSSDIQSLFTPPQLLNQCRNFLKYRQTAGEKVLDTFKPHEQNYLRKEESKECLFSRNNQQEATPEDTDTEPWSKQSASKKSGTAKSSYEQSNRETEVKAANTYSYFQSYAAERSNLGRDSHGRNSAQQNNSTQQMSTGNNSHSNSSIFAKPLVSEQCDYNFNIESFLDEVLERNEMNAFISSAQLAQTVNAYSNRAYEKALRQLICSKSDICLSQVARHLQDSYQQHEHSKYSYKCESVQDICMLLDIEQKGYICESDIESFLMQIKEAEVDNLSEVSRELWRIFENADFKEQNRITYWSLCLIKNTEQFTNICQLLGEFQFQIENQ